VTSFAPLRSRNLVRNRRIASGIGLVRLILELTAQAAENTAKHSITPDMEFMKWLGVGQAAGDATSDADSGEETPTLEER